MSRVSIYENNWINLVFEKRNKLYGAFQLRQKSDETTLLAFCLTLFFVASLISIATFLSNLEVNKQSLTPPEIFAFPVIHLADIPPIKPKRPEKVASPISKKNEDNKPLKSLSNPKITEAENASKDITPKKELPTGPSQPLEGATKGTGESTWSPIAPEAGKSVNSDSKEGIIDATTLDRLPEFPGGIAQFYNYIGENFERLEIDETISVLMSFVIEKDGSMTDIKVLRSSSPSIDREAVRVLKSLRIKWKPGYKEGQAVRTLYKLPIKVKK